MMKFQGAKKKQKVAKGSGSVKGRAVRVGRVDSVRRRKIGRCGQFIGAGGPAVRAVQRFGRISSVRRTAARSVVSVRPGKLKRVKGKIGKSEILQTIDEAKVKHNSLAIIFEFPALF